MIEPESSTIIRSPIRLMFGIGNNMVMGFSIVYEKADGKAGRTWVWYDDEDYKKIVFIDEGPSELVWEKTQTTSITGLFRKREEVYENKELKEIRIRRDFQFKP